MIQKKKKQIKVILLITLVVLILGVGTWGIFKVINNNGEPQSNEQIDLSQFELKELIVETKLPENDMKEQYNSKNIKVLLTGENNETKMYLLNYDTEEQTREAYEKLKKDKNIEKVDINKVVTRNEAPQLPQRIIEWALTSGDTMTSWGAVSMGLDETLAKVNSKQNNPEVIVAVLDTGFNMEHNVVTEDESISSRIMEGYNAIDSNTNIDDDDPKGGHGSNVGSIILEGAPDNVKIMPIKVLNAEGKGSTADIIIGMNYAIENGADIINMSLGGEGRVPDVQQAAIDRAYERGITVIVASGNGDEDGNALNLDEQGIDASPAEAEHVIAVGAVRTKLMETDDDFITKYDQYIKSGATDMEITSFSNYGSALDFAAPGMYIIGFASKVYGAPVSILAGTSQATPHISAAAATIKSYNKEYTSDQIETILKYYAYDLGEQGKDPYYGNGFVTFKNFEECECNSENCDKIYCFGCTNEACKFHVASNNELTSIAVTSEPTKKEYEVGDLFNKAGMVVTATYNDGTTKEVTDYTYTPTTELTMHDDIINISYTENEITKTTTLNITVKDKPALGVTLEAIEITAPPAKIKYNVGETFDKTGMVVTANYDDGSKKIVTNYTYTPTTALTEHDTEIEISYTEDGVTKTAKQTIEVTKVEEQVTLTNIRIATPPSRTIYEVGEMFEKAGMTVIAEYSDRTEKMVDRYTVYPTTAFTASSTKVTIEYSEDGVTKKVDQPITIKSQTQNPPEPPAPEEITLSNIMMKTKPNKTEYIVGERFDKTGMVIVATYSDGSTKTITNYTCSPLTQLKATDTKIIVSYTENNVIKTIEVPITVSAKTTEPNNEQPSGINDNNMFQYVTDNNSGSGSGSGTTTKVENKDGTTSGRDIVYTGIEDHIIPIAITVIAIIGIASFVSYRRYKDI